jgi:hypothetical protein
MILKQAESNQTTKVLTGPKQSAGKQLKRAWESYRIKINIKHISAGNVFITRKPTNEPSYFWTNQ